MKRFAGSYVVCFLVTFAASFVLASAAIAPLTREALAGSMRAPTDAGGIPALTLGFALLSAAATLLTLRLGLGRGWWADGLVAGGIVSTVVVADYLIVIGWSTLSPRALVLSGLLSAVAPLLGCLAVAFATRRGRAAARA